MQGQNARESYYTKLSATLIFASGTIFLIFNTIAEGTYPDYSLKTNALSDLGALGAPTAFLWDGQLFITGALGFLGMYLLFFKSTWSETIKRRSATAILFLLPPAGTITISLFPENFIGAIHSFGAITSFTFGGISAMYAYRLTKPPFRYFSLILGVIPVGATSLLGAGSIFGFGLIERVVVYPFTIWSISFAGYLMAITDSS
jgi:hypothetical membrane protein